MVFPKGIDIVLHTKTQTGVDPFGNPLITETDITVSNVLVTPASADDALAELQMSGKHIEYTLCIPKGDTNVWEDVDVSFWGKRFRTIGIPKEYIEANLPPLPWNKQIRVERYE